MFILYITSQNKSILRNVLYDVFLLNLLLSHVTRSRQCSKTSQQLRRLNQIIVFVRTAGYCTTRIMYMSSFKKLNSFIDPCKEICEI